MKIPQEEEEVIQMDTAGPSAVVPQDSLGSDLDTGGLETESAPEPNTTTEDVSTPMDSHSPVVTMNATPSRTPAASIPPTPGHTTVTSVPPGATKTPVRKSYSQRSH